ncbi:MAG: hypothetical protein ACRDPK_15515 [Carbonactinosporaceae bacterium]
MARVFADWTGQSVDHGKWIAAALPLSAVILFEGLMHEAGKAALQRIYGAVVPRPTLACWLLSFRRTFKVFRATALRPLAAAERVLAGGPALDAGTVQDDDSTAVPVPSSEATAASAAVPAAGTEGAASVPPSGTGTEDALLPAARPLMRRLGRVPSRDALRTELRIGTARAGALGRVLRVEYGS